MDENNDNIEISIIKLIKYIRSKAVKVSIVGVIFAVSTFVYFEYFKKEIFRSEGTLILDLGQKSSTVYGEYSPISSNISDYLSLFDKRQIASRTLEDLNLNEEISSMSLKNNIEYSYEQSPEKKMRSIDLKLNVHNEKSNLILANYIDNYLRYLNSKLAIDALNYFESEYTVTTERYHIRNEELKKEIVQIEDLMSDINRSVPSDKIQKLKNEGVLINLSDVLNENYILLETQMIERKRQLFNYKLKIETFENHLENIANMKKDINEDVFGDPELDIIYSSAVVFKEEDNSSDNAISKGSVVKAIMALIIGLLIPVCYYVYQFVLQNHSRNEQ